MSNTNQVEYKTYHCLIHKKIIHYFKNHDHITGKFHCWDCVRDLNTKKEKKYNEQGIQRDPGEGQEALQDGGGEFQGAVQGSWQAG